jgi:hypothetical protein
LGGAIMIAKLIVTPVELEKQEIIESEGYETVTIDTKGDFSKICYKGKGKRILNYSGKF